MVIHKGKRKLILLDQPFAAHGRSANIQHYVFTEGIPLSKIEDLRSFTNYKEYAEWLLKTQEITMINFMKMMEQFRAGVY